MRDRVVERLFSMFTSSDCAEAMAGDLVEDRAERGPVWYWFQVVRIILALLARAAAHAPLAALALVVAPLLAGTVMVSLFPPLINPPGRWLTASLVWWGTMLSSGALLAAIALRRGKAASVTLALAGVAVVFMCLFVIPNYAFPQDVGWKDPSPHKTTLVTVDTDVQLEVLDWGGSGPAIVLLAGLGATAHHYDDLAPSLTPRYRVVGLTRRGHRGSSAAPAGYGPVRLADDVMRVIDALGLDNPVVIGHSFAGEEMHVLGARHAAKIRGLVYVDAAFDRGDDADTEAYNAAAKPVPGAPTSTDADRTSFTALRAYLDKYGGAGPEAWLRTRYRTNPDGSVAGMWAPDPPIRQAMMKDIQAAYKPYNPERIRVPALAIYAIPKSADDLMRRGSSDRVAFPELVARAAGDPVLREQVEKLFVLTRDRVRKHEKWFEAFADRGRVVELSGTHNLVISNAREVLEQIEAFMSSLAARR
jgi:pimeloyl-ACP methyl ester carboxylesterase